MKKLILGLIFAGLSFSQNTGQNVVSLNLITNATYTNAACSVACSLTTGALQNIGQTSHIVKLQFRLITGTVSYFGNIQGSADCTNWFNIGPTVDLNPLVSNSTLTLIGYGAFPCIRVTGSITVAAASQAALIEESYTGTSAPVFNNVDEFSANSGMITFAVSPIVYGANTLIESPIGNANVITYGFSVYAPSTLTSLTFFCSPDGTAVSSTPMIIANGTNLQAIQPIEIRPIFTCSGFTRLYYVAVGSGAASSLNVQYRIE